MSRIKKIIEDVNKYNFKKNELLILKDSLSCKLMRTTGEEKERLRFYFNQKGIKSSFLMGFVDGSES